MAGIFHATAAAAIIVRWPACRRRRVDLIATKASREKSWAGEALFCSLDTLIGGE